jgi:hypothetical protein
MNSIGISSRIVSVATAILLLQISPVLSARTSNDQPVAMPPESLWLEAVYDVAAGDHSFTALISGGTANNVGHLDGVILAGWRIGARVRVEFVALPAGCALNPTSTCFQGSIHIEGDSKD